MLGLDLGQPVCHTAIRYLSYIPSPAAPFGLVLQMKTVIAPCSLLESFFFDSYSVWGFAPGLEI